jgi:dTDP-4-dehydrorhamnose 3,5-epimerase
MDKIADPIQLPIEGVVIQPLKILSDERGAVLHMLRLDSPLYDKFGEIYFSEINPGVIKAWKRHLRMTQRLAVPMGRVKFVLYDNRSDSPTNGREAVCLLGRPAEYRLLVVPPGVWYGFQGIDSRPSLIANCPDLPHDPAEVELAPPGSGLIPYQW